MNRPAVFLDRDGTIIREAEYLADPAGVELLPGAASGIQALRAAGFFTIVTSNQSGVARGYFDEATVAKVNQRMLDLLAHTGAGMDGVYYCPHLPTGKLPEYAMACNCRKPGPGMIEAAAKTFPIELGASWVVGDKALDIEFGIRAGLRTVLVLTGYGQKTLDQGFAAGLAPDIVAPDLSAAAAAILKETA